MSEISNESSAEGSELTAAQKSRIERNRVKALALRQAKLVCHPYASNNKDPNTSEASIIKVQGTKYVDGGGGFLLEQTIVPTGADDNGKFASSTKGVLPKQAANEAIAIPVMYEECLECGDAFIDSFLLNNFDFCVCDKCRDSDDKHSLITRTEAKAEYLLKDCDFDKREPPLKYISRKNPHNLHWGEMKLYLHLQVEKRAMEVWGSEEELMRQHEHRESKREISKVKRYNKQMKQLRMEVRSSLYTKDTTATHVHDFGPDTYNEEEDNYTHTCETCNYSETYEKM